MLPELQSNNIFFPFAPGQIIQITGIKSPQGYLLTDTNINVLTYKDFRTVLAEDFSIC